MFRVFNLKLVPQKDCLIPHSDGYLLYSALLNKFSNSNRLHDSYVGVNLSSLDGPFKSVNKDRKKVFCGAEYDVRLVLSDNEIDTKSVVKDIIEYDLSFKVGNAVFDLKQFSIDDHSVKDIISGSVTDKLKVEFEDPTYIDYNGNVEKFPARNIIVKSIQDRWNKIVSEPYNINLDHNQIRSDCYEESVNISKRMNVTVANKNGHRVSKPAFRGECTYSRNPDAKNWEEIHMLLQVGQFIGVGSSVARGCGTINIK